MLRLITQPPTQFNTEGDRDRRRNGVKMQT